MNKEKREDRAMRIVTGALVGLMLAASAPAFAEEIVIGAQYPLSGPLASIASPAVRIGTEIAVKRVNDAQLAGKGNTIKVLIEDNAGDVKQAITLMSRFAVADRVIAAAGVVGSAMSLPTAPVANANKTPLLAIASSPAVALSGPWSFNIVETPATQTTALGALAIDQLHVHNIALVYDRGNDASVRLRDILAKIFKDRGVNVVSTDGIGATETNFSGVATKLANEKIDAIFIDSIPQVSANFIIQLRQAGLDPTIRVICGGQVSTPAFLRLVGDAGEGIYYIADYFPGMANDENKYLVDAYRKRTGIDPDQFAAWAYTGILLIAHAIDNAGPNPDREKVRDALAKIKNVVTPLGDGSFSFDANRSPTYPVLPIRVVGGKATIVK
jgi:branched-chain amino acid transport system substrate-binding protein